MLCNGTFRLLRSIDHYQMEVLITLAAVMGGYALASRLHVSGALAMSDTTRNHLDLFWELLDEILKAVLFVLIGLEVIVIRFPTGIAGAAALAMAVTLITRSLTVGAPVDLWHRQLRKPAGSGRVLTWGGPRGGISVALALALALSLPLGPHLETLIALTYCVVVFSILVQGLTNGRVVRRAVKI